MFNSNFISKANTLAAQIRRHDGSDRKTSMKAAFAILRNEPNAQLLVFTKRDGSEARRVVRTDWNAFYTPNGKGRPTPPHLQLFADLSRVYACKSPIISAVRDNIISLAA